MCNSPVTIETLETELAALLATLALLADQSFGGRAGSRLLELPHEFDSITYREVAVRKTWLGQMLPVWYAYGYEAQVLAGVEISSWGNWDDQLDRLGKLTELFREGNHYVEECLDLVSDQSSVAGSIGHLEALQARVRARLSLDCGDSLEPKDLAVLAEIEVRSVRDATHAEGTNRLAIDADNRVSNAEALRWLTGCPSFVATTRRRFDATLAQQSQRLFAPELPKFVLERLRLVSRSWIVNQEIGLFDDELLPEAARMSGLPLERLMAATRLPLDIHPADCPSLAKLLQVDVAWFTQQVMCGLYPKQMPYSVVCN